MAVPQEQSLDEIQWRSPRDVQEMGGIHTNTVLPYFYKSPFFDPVSNNATINTQAIYNPNMLYLIQTRQAFEARLRTMQGLEFMVTADPSDNGEKTIENGVWVISKQNRRKVAGAEDLITPISSYFVVGENIYMAPVISQILGSRLLSTVTTLTELVSKANTLPSFTPSRGHHYILPAPRSSLSVSSAQAMQASKEGTPIPGTQDSQTTARSSTLAKPASTLSQETQLIEDSFRLAARYGNEYMNESPLVGEPGAFIFKKAREVSRPAPPKLDSKTSTQAEVEPSSRTEPSRIETTTVEMPSRKLSKGGEKSPTTPSTKEKKMRRKSKAAGATVVSTPK